MINKINKEKITYFVCLQKHAALFTFKKFYIKYMNRIYLII